MRTLGTDSVYPSLDETISDTVGNKTTTDFIGSNGLTKREYFAALVLQGMASIDHYAVDVSRAVIAADKLIEELNKSGEKSAT